MLDLKSSLAGANYGTYTQTFALDPSWAIDTEMSFYLTEVGGDLRSFGTASMVGLDNINAISYNAISFSTASAPEPARMMLLGLGLLGLAGVSRKKS